VPIFGRRDAVEPTIDAELDRLRAIRVSAEEELGRLRRELAERVAIVERKERELADAIAKARRGGVRRIPPGADEAVVHAHVALAAHAEELNRRERELAQREREFVNTEAELARRLAEAAKTPRDVLAQLEARMEALREMEQAFARTQAELAQRSDDLARREAELIDRAGAGTAGAGSGPTSRVDFDELDERIRRLEQRTREASADKSFGDGLRTLERRGVGGLPPG
jgi:DNA repair exonuclease SbcCD ATPase subunit